MANIKLIEKFTDELNRVYLDLKNFKLANKDIKEDIEGKIDKDYLVKKRKELVDKANDLKKEVDILLGFKNLGDGLSYWNRFKAWIKDNNPVKTCLYVIVFAAVFYFVVNFLGITLNRVNILMKSRKSSISSKKALDMNIVNMLYSVKKER